MQLLGAHARVIRELLHQHGRRVPPLVNLRRVGRHLGAADFCGRGRKRRGMFSVQGAATSKRARCNFVQALSEE